jgi:protein TonB
MSVSIHTFPPLQTFNSRSWALLLIVMLHLGFFWALTSGLAMRIAAPLMKKTDYVVLAPATPPIVEPRPILPVNGPTTPTVIQDPELPPLRTMEDEKDTGLHVPPGGPTIGTGGGSAEQPHEPLKVQPAIPAEGLSEPVYPAQEIRQQHTGTVLLSVEVLPNGRVGEVRIDQSSGYPRLDASATHEARQWRFKPGTSDGVAVAMWRRVPITFRLK